jgi:hypothetical protein
MIGRDAERPADATRSPSTLGAFQDSFAAALMATGTSDPDDAVKALVAQPGFAVYRNTVLAGCIDALQANYPAVERLVGEDWFRAAAAVHARVHLPEQPSLLLYGERFPAFLSAFPPASEVPYLADVARVDRAWSEAHVAADEPALDPSELASLSIVRMNGLTLRPHAATRWVWSDEWPIHALWVRNRFADGEPPSDVRWTGEGVLLTRPFGAVLTSHLPRGGAALLDACAAGASISEAVGEVLGVAPETDIAALFDALLGSGAFSRLEAVPSPAIGARSAVSAVQPASREEKPQ